MVSSTKHRLPPRSPQHRDEEVVLNDSSFVVAPARSPSIAKKFGRTNRYVALRVETSDSNMNSASTGPTVPQEIGDHALQSVGGQQSQQKAEKQVSPSETTRRLVDSFRRRGESPSSATASAKTSGGPGGVRPMSPVSEGFLENLQSQRQRTEERVQVIKKLRHLKEQQTKSSVPSPESCDSSNIQVPSNSVKRTSFSSQQPPVKIKSGALRHYGEHSQLNTKTPTVELASDESNKEIARDTKPKPRGTFERRNLAQATTPSRVTSAFSPRKDDPNQVPVTATLSNRSTTIEEKRETCATERSETMPSSEQDDLREPHHSSSNSQDEASITMERDRANSFLVELAKAKAEILDLQKRLAAATNASQATRDELLKVKQQQRTPFWKRGSKKHQAILESRTAEDNEDFVKQLLNVVHSLPECDEICLRINLRNGEGGWEIVSARAENPRLKEEDNP